MKNVQKKCDGQVLIRNRFIFSKILPTQSPFETCLLKNDRTNQGFPNLSFCRLYFQKTYSLSGRLNIMLKHIHNIPIKNPVPTIVRNCAIHDFATFVRICTLENSTEEQHRSRYRRTCKKGGTGEHHRRR